jgi:fructose-specific phosphotransferase system IIC component
MFYKNRIANHIMCLVCIGMFFTGNTIFWLAGRLFYAIHIMVVGVIIAGSIVFTDGVQQVASKITVFMLFCLKVIEKQIGYNLSQTRLVSWVL